MWSVGDAAVREGMKRMLLKQRNWEIPTAITPTTTSAVAAATTIGDSLITQAPLYNMCRAYYCIPRSETWVCRDNSAHSVPAQAPLV